MLTVIQADRKPVEVSYPASVRVIPRADASQHIKSGYTSNTWDTPSPMTRCTASPLYGAQISGGGVSSSLLPENHHRHTKPSSSRGGKSSLIQVRGALPHHHQRLAPLLLSHTRDPSPTTRQDLPVRSSRQTKIPWRSKRANSISEIESMKTSISPARSG
jgi:hypothetical protein